jgi:geranylgeranylglycerol-phosphate geranylgeranyltransferase
LKPEDHIDFLITVSAVAVIANGSLNLPHLGRLLLAFLFSFFIVGGTIVLNQYFDIDVDKINRPHRPIPSGRIKPRTVFAFAVGAYALSLLTSILLGPVYVAISLVAIFASIIYSHPSHLVRKKSVIAQVTIINIGYTVLAFLIGWCVYRPVSEIPWWFLVFLFVSDIGGVFAKDYRDLAGDKEHGYRTLPTMFGLRKAAQINAIIYVLPFFTLYFLGIFGMVSQRFMVLAAYCIISGVFAFSLLMSNKDGRNALLCYYIMELNFVVVRILSVWAMVI